MFCESIFISKNKYARSLNQFYVIFNGPTLGSTQAVEALQLQWTSQKPGLEELPMSEVRGGGQECQAAMAQEQQSARLRRRRYSREELPNFRGQGRLPGGATHTLRPGAAA